MATAAAPTMDYERAARLFESDATRDMQDRQVAVLRRIHRLNPDGFLLSELADVQAVFEMALDHVTETDDTFVEPLIALLQLAQKPFRASKANEELQSEDAVCGFLRTLARTLFAPHPRLQLAALETLLNFAAGGEDPDDKGPDDLRPTGWRLNHQLIARSEIVPDIVSAFSREVAELFLADTNNDGELSAAEYHRFKVTNDSDAHNDDETLEDKLARQRALGAGAGAGAASPDVPAADRESPAILSEADTKALVAASASDSKLDGEDVAAAAAAAEPSYFLCVMVRLIKELSEYGDSATNITRQGALQNCVTILSVVPFQEEIIGHTVEVLWNVLEHSYSVLGGGDVSLTLDDLLDKHRNANAAYVLGNEDAATALTSLLEISLTRGYRLQDKEVRNDVVVVATLLARRPDNRIHLQRSGFLDLALLYGTAAETQLPTDASPRNYATAEPVDHQLKLLLWSFVGVMCGLTHTGAPEHAPTGSTVAPVKAPPDHQATFLSSVRTSWFPHALLLYLDPVQAHHNPYIQAWSPAQARALELTALRLLELQEESGPQIMLLFIRKHSDLLTVARAPEHPATDDATDDGGERLEDGDVDPERVELALRALRAMVLVMDFSDELGAMGAVADLLRIAESFDPDRAAEPLAATSSKTLPTPLSTLEVVFTLLARLCSGHKDNQKHLRHEGGVKLVLPWLRFPAAVETTTPQMVPAALSLVWEGIAGNYKNESRFIAGGGMDALLDLVETCPPFIRGQILGCLADLTLNTVSHPYVRVWKSDENGRSCASYLLQFWVEEEDRLSGVGSTAPSATAAAGAGAGAGSVGDDSGSARPRRSSSPLSRTGGSTAEARPAFDRLRRALKAAKMWRRVEEPAPGKSLVDRVLQQDLRPKIYAILANIGFDNAEDDVKGNFDDLTFKEQSALCVASRYADYRKGAAWRDVLDNLAKVGVLPVDTDAAVADGNVAEADAMALDVEKRQEYLAESAAAEAKAAEEKDISAVLTQRHTEEEAYRLATRRIGMGAMSLQEWLAAKSRLKGTRR